MLDSELIGLAPAAALLDVADHIGVATGRLLEDRVREAAGWLRIRRYEPGMVLELRLSLGALGRTEAPNPQTKDCPTECDAASGPAALLQHDDRGLGRQR